MFTVVVLSFIVSHILQISVSLPGILDALLLRADVIPLPMVSVLIALMEVGALLVIDALLFRMNKASANTAMRRYWLFCSVLALLLAFSPVPEPPVITFELDRFFFKMLPIYLITPQAAVQILVHCLFPVVEDSMKIWIQQYSGLLFYTGHFVYLTLLSIRARKGCKQYTENKGAV